MGIYMRQHAPPQNGVEEHESKSKHPPPGRKISFNEKLIKKFKSCEVGQVIWFFDNKDSESIDFDKESFVKQEILQNGGQVIMNRI